MSPNKSILKSKRGFLKKALVVTRSEKLKLRALAESLRNEFGPQNPYEEFLFEKLIVDFARLAKLYEFEKKRMFDSEQCLNNALLNSESDRFIRYKNSIENDIKDGYARLQELSAARM